MNGDMTILDSNAIIYLSKGMINIESIFEDKEDYAVSVISYMEVLGFDFQSQKEEDFIRSLLSLFKIIYIDDRIVNTVISLRKTYKVKLPDAIICASCITNNAVLLSNDEQLNNIHEVTVRKIELTASQNE